VTQASGIVVKRYRPPATLWDFHGDPSFIRGVQGPVGSGKSSSVICMDSLIKAARQKSSPTDGVRYSKELVIRASYPRLLTSTIPTWQKWVPAEQFSAPMRWGPPITHHLRWLNGPGDIVDLEVIFMSVESDAEVDKLDSFEASRIRINEAIECGPRLFAKCAERVNRFPPKEHGFCTEPGVVMDFNAPDTDHWLYKIMEREMPANWRFWRQPPALLEDDAGDLVDMDGRRYRVNGAGDPKRNMPAADNLDNLPPGYYRDQVATKNTAEVKVRLLNRPGTITDGDPVHPLYDEDYHGSDTVLPNYPGLPILMGWDFGGTPACVIAQFTPKGQLRILAELVADHYTTVERFRDEVVKPFLAMEFANQKVSGWGDPAGMEGEGHEETCFDALKLWNIKPSPDLQNVWSTRVDAVDALLRDRLPRGVPKIIISRRCSMLRAGLSGKYQIERVQRGSNQGVLRSKPLKNAYSHPCEALGYLCMGIQGKPDQNQAKIRASIARQNRSLRPMSLTAGY
jgi:hypothetical protein